MSWLFLLSLFISVSANNTELIGLSKELIRGMMAIFLFSYKVCFIDFNLLGIIMFVENQFLYEVTCSWCDTLHGWFQFIVPLFPNCVAKKGIHSGNSKLKSATICHLFTYCFGLMFQQFWHTGKLPVTFSVTAMQIFQECIVHILYDVVICVKIHSMLLASITSRFDCFKTSIRLKLNANLFCIKTVNNISLLSISNRWHTLSNQYIMILIVSL